MIKKSSFIFRSLCCIALLNAAIGRTSLLANNIDPERVSYRSHKEHDAFIRINAEYHDTQTNKIRVVGTIAVDGNYIDGLYSYSRNQGIGSELFIQALETIKKTHNPDGSRKYEYAYWDAVGNTSFYKRFGAHCVTSDSKRRSSCSSCHEMRFYFDKDGDPRINYEQFKKQTVVPKEPL